MQIRQAFLTAALSALALAGCSQKSPTDPPSMLSGPDRFTLSTTLSDTSGQPSLTWVQLTVDHVVEADSCPPADVIPDYDGNGVPTSYSCSVPSFSTVLLSAKDQIAPGSHILRISIVQQPSNVFSTYKVDAFTIQVSDASGKLLKSINVPAQTARLMVGQEFDFSFTV
jgi:hypothetical protein